MTVYARRTRLLCPWMRHAWFAFKLFARSTFHIDWRFMWYHFLILISSFVSSSRRQVALKQQILWIQRGKLQLRTFKASAIRQQVEHWGASHHSSTSVPRRTAQEERVSYTLVHDDQFMSKHLRDPHSLQPTPLFVVELTLTLPFIIMIV